jgi:hypothetical protein
MSKHATPLMPPANARCNDDEIRAVPFCHRASGRSRSSLRNDSRPTRSRRTGTRFRSAVLLTGLLLFQIAHAQVTFDVTVDEVPGAQMPGLPAFSTYRDTIIRHVTAAGGAWAQYLAGTAVISVHVLLYPQGNLPADNPELLADIPNTFRDRSGVVAVENGIATVEFAPAYRIRTGNAVDSSGQADVTIRLGEKYVKTMLYFDANPLDRSGPVPSDKTEAFGRFVHELGHALGFNGFYRGDGTFDAGNMQSTFDRYITWSEGGTSQFNGPQAMQLYGGPVPLTANERGHVGSDSDPRLYALAAAEAMNGRTVYEGIRYDVSPLDVRMLCDIGVPCMPQPVAARADAPAGASATRMRAIEYYNAGLDHYFLTALPDEIVKLDDGTIAGWARTGESFGVFPADQAGSAPVCRFFSAAFAPKSSHFYTPFPQECEIVKRNADWQYEATVFAVELPDGAGNCASGLAPLYRLYNNGSGGAPNHRYTTALDVRAAMLASGWIPEGIGSLGVIACVPR